MIESWKQSALAAGVVIVAIVTAVGLQAWSVEHGPTAPPQGAPETVTPVATPTPIPSAIPFIDSFFGALDAAFLPGSDPVALLTPFYDLQSGPAVERLLHYEVATAQQFHDCLAANGYTYRSVETVYKVLGSETVGDRLTIDLQTEVRTQWSPSPGSTPVNSSSGENRRMVWVNREGTYLLAADGYTDQLAIVACPAQGPRVPVTVLPPAPAGTSSPIPLHPGDPTAYAEALAVLQDYLDTWKGEGPLVASQFNAVPFDANTPKNVVVGGALLDGKVVSYSPLQLINENSFTLGVTVDLHFAPGAAVPWNDGPNTSFVTFARADTLSPFKIVQQGTSP